MGSFRAKELVQNSLGSSGNAICRVMTYGTLNLALFCFGFDFVALHRNLSKIVIPMNQTVAELGRGCINNRRTDGFCSKSRHLSGQLPSHVRVWSEDIRGDPLVFAHTHIYLSLIHI